MSNLLNSSKFSRQFKFVTTNKCSHMFTPICAETSISICFLATKAVSSSVKGLDNNLEKNLYTFALSIISIIRNLLICNICNIYMSNAGITANCFALRPTTYFNTFKANTGGIIYYFKAVIWQIAETRPNFIMEMNLLLEIIFLYHFL